MKKLLSIFMAAVIFAGCTATAFAEQNNTFTGELNVISFNVDGLPVPSFLSSTKRNAVTATKLIAQQINTLSVDDNTALRMVRFYPEWESGKAYTAANGCTAGYKVTRNGKLWKLRQEHTSQADWAPGETGTESLWTEICEAHDGTKYDPVPYSGNMALENGKYYTQDGVLYLCNRDTGNPVYHPLSALVGLYVTVVEVN